MRRRHPAAVAAFLALVYACSSGGAGSPAGVDGGSGDASATSDGGPGATDGSAASADGNVSVDSGGDGSIATDGAAADAGSSCVTKSSIVKTIQAASGECSFPFTQTYTSGFVNLVLTPGWGTICYAGSSSSCGSGASADGWWFSAPNEITLCDASCDRFYKQTIAGKITAEMGCASETCAH